MSLLDLTSYAIKAATALLGLLVLDYTFFEGRMVRQAVMGFERMSLDAPDLIPRILESFVDSDLWR